MKNRLTRSVLYPLFTTLSVASLQQERALAQAAPMAHFAAANDVASSGLPSLPNTMPSSSVTSDALPEAPVPQEQAADKKSGTSEPRETPINPIALLSPRLNTNTVLSAHDKWQIYYHKTYSPAALVFPLFGSGLRMANPKKEYPRDWKDGMGAFGRDYGNSIAQRTARDTADFGAQVLLHEDPRYQRSSSKNPAARIGHALAWTLVDKSDSGHRMPAFSTFTSAAAGGFVGMAYLPDGYNDTTHALQRTAMGVEGRAFTNLLTEFQPLWGPVAAKLHVPKLLPAWWVAQPKAPQTKP